jgi:CRISPR-associated endoribonuclease Cas6
MRLKITIIPKEEFPKNAINQYHIHSFLWELLKDTKYSKLHDQPRFKYFCFSEIFPIGDFKKNEAKYIILSSPNEDFINTIYEKIKETPNICLNRHKFEVYCGKPFKLKFRTRAISGSPLVLQVQPNIYWSVKYHSLSVFLRRLYENSIKKYESYYGERINLGIYDLFDSLSFKKQIAVHIKKHGKDIRIIGTKWIFEKRRIPKELYKFYNFLLDCGLGEKNSFGFGFLNPL